MSVNMSQLVPNQLFRRGGWDAIPTDGADDVMWGSAGRSQRSISNVVPAISVGFTEIVFPTTEYVLTEKTKRVQFSGEKCLSHHTHDRSAVRDDLIGFCDECCAVGYFVLLSCVYRHALVCVSLAHIFARKRKANSVKKVVFSCASGYG